MSQIVDNLIAYRILSMLVKPFTETDAYRLGIIDADGKNLIKSKDFTTQEQRDAYSYLNRLVFNLKKTLNKLPGGDNMTKNLIAAFFLVKESYKNRSLQINEQQLHRLIKLQEEGVVFAVEQVVVDDFLALNEDVAANVTGSGVATDVPVIHHSKRFKRFVVNDDIYNKFAEGKARYRRWSQYLNLEDDGQRMIYDYAKKNPYGVIVLQNGKQTKAIHLNTNRRSKNTK